MVLRDHKEEMIKFESIEIGDLIISTPTKNNRTYFNTGYVLYYVLDIEKNNVKVNAFYNLKKNGKPIDPKWDRNGIETVTRDFLEGLNNFKTWTSKLIKKK